MNRRMVEKEYLLKASRFTWEDCNAFEVTFGPVALSVVSVKEEPVEHQALSQHESTEVTSDFNSHCWEGVPPTVFSVKEEDKGHISIWDETLQSGISLHEFSNSQTLYAGNSDDLPILPQPSPKMPNDTKDEAARSSTSNVDQTSTKHKSSPSSRSEKQHACNLCEKRFVILSQLLKHQKTHSQVKTPIPRKTHPCDICGRKCRSPDALANHYRTHTGEKPYNCPHCEKSFSSKTGLRQHVGFHTQNKQYSCTYCSYSCVMKVNLTRHLRRHTKEKPFECSYCGKCLTFKHTLKNHIRNKHGGEDQQ